MPSLSSRSVLTMLCSTTWFGGSVTGSFVLSQLQRVNMSHSNFFQLNLHAVFVMKVGPHNAMFYDVFRRQCDRLLCSVQKEKNLIKIQNILPISVGSFYLFREHQCF